MSTTLPPMIQAAKGKPHHVFDWTVPARLDGKPLAIAGSLDYQPPPSGTPRVLLGALVLVGVGGALALFLRLRRK